jgi:CRP-like cAMP-binding protein
VDLLSALLETELFEGFSRADLEPLEPALRRRTFPKGAHLWFAGDPIVFAVLITSGMGKIRHIESDGSEVVIQLVVPGETAGEFPFFDEEARRWYDAVAVEPIEAIVIPRDHLLFVLDRDPRLTRKLAASMLRRLMRDHAALTEIQLVDLEVRLARRLLALGRLKGEHSPEGTLIGLKLSQSLLASTVRASRENVNRALARLSDAGLISLKGGYIVVRDTLALTARAKR